MEINLDSSALPGQYTLLTSSGITGTFDSITFTGPTPKYSLSYLPIGAPTFVQLNFLGHSNSSCRNAADLPPSNSAVEIAATLNGSPVLNPALTCCGRPILLGPLPGPGTGPTVYTITQQTGNVTCRIGQTQLTTGFGKRALQNFKSFFLIGL